MMNRSCQRLRTEGGVERGAGEAWWVSRVVIPFCVKPKGEHITMHLVIISKVLWFLERWFSG